MKWVALFLACALAATAQAQLKADHVLVKKSERKLFLLRDGVVYETFNVVFGPGRGPKLTEGDERTPEGEYILDYKKSPSRFYKSIHISYPNAQDRERSARLGLAPGGAIMIHGQPKVDRKTSRDMRYFNWTDGCVALANADMELVWRAVDAGTPITILP